MTLRNTLFKPWFVNEDDWGIEIIDGPFKEVCIQFKDIAFEENSEGNCQLDYHMVRKPEEITQEILDGPEFTSTLEIIINEILRTALEDYESSRNNHTQESST